MSKAETADLIVRLKLAWQIDHDRLAKEAYEALEALNWLVCSYGRSTRS